MSKILFVDDCKEPQWFLEEPVTWVKTGEEAVEEWSRGDYDTLYLDNDMGMGIQGYQALDLIIAVRPPVHVYVVSNNFVAKKRIFDICGDHNIPCQTGMTLSDKRMYEVR